MWIIFWEICQGCFERDSCNAQGVGLDGLVGPFRLYYSMILSPRYVLAVQESLQQRWDNMSKTKKHSTLWPTVLQALPLTATVPALGKAYTGPN